MKDEIKEKCSNCEYSRQCVTVKQIDLECCLKDRKNEKKDEIKKILDNTLEICTCAINEDCTYAYFNVEDIKSLIDDITNSREENEKLQKEVEKLQRENNVLRSLVPNNEEYYFSVR